MAATRASRRTEDPLVLLGKALRHPLRIELLEQYAQRKPFPPTAAEGDAALGVVSYHVRELAKAGFIKIHHKEARRGAVAHYYRLTDRGRWAVQTIHHLRSIV